MSIFDDDIKRLDFEDYIWFIFAILAFFNIFGDNLQKKFLRSNDKYYENKANEVYIFVTVVILIIYIYFFYRNYKAFKKVKQEDKGMYLIKLIGSALLIGGIICLLYFQYNQSDFIGTPAIWLRNFKKNVFIVYNIIFLW